MLFYLGSATTPIFVNEVLLEHSHAHSLIYCLWLLLLQQHSWLVVIDHMACKPKILTIRPLRKSFLIPTEKWKGRRKRTLKAFQESILQNLLWPLIFVRIRTHSKTKAVNTELDISYWEKWWLRKKESSKAS